MDRIFWTSDIEPDAYRNEYPDASEDELYNIASEDNNTQFQDDKDNLSHIIPENGILIYATLGLWTGKHQAVLQDSSSLHSVGDCMKSYVSGMSDLEFFVSEKGEFQCREPITMARTCTHSAPGVQASPRHRKKISSTISIWERTAITRSNANLPARRHHW